MIITINCTFIMAPYKRGLRSRVLPCGSSLSLSHLPAIFFFIGIAEEGHKKRERRMAILVQSSTPHAVRL